MPISFQTADPSNPQVSFESGQRQQGQQEYENYLNAQRQAAQQYFQQANLDQNQQQHADQMNLAQGRFDQQNEQFRAQQEPSARDRFMGQQELKQMQARADIHTAMKDQEVTQAEKLRMQQMQNAIGDINANVANGTLRPEEAAPMIMQLRTGIDPIKQRDSHQRVKIQQQAIDERIKQNELDAKIQAQTTDFLTQNAIGKQIPMPGGFGVVQPGGKIDYHANSKPERPEFSPAERLKLYERAVEKVDGIRDRTGAVTPGTGMLKSGPAGSEVWLPGHREAQIENEFQKLLGMMSASNKPGEPSAQASVPNSTPTPQGQGRQEPAAPPPSPLPERNGPPLPPDRTKWEPSRVEAVSQMDKDLAILKAKTMDGSKKSAAIASLEAAMGLYRETGGVMDAKTLKMYKDHLTNYRNLRE